MKPLPRLSTILVLAALACGQAGAQPTIVPSSSPIALETPTSAPPPAATEASRPPEAVWVNTPGNGSRLVGQVHIEGQADPTFEQALVVQVVALDDEPFTVLAQQTVMIGADAGQRGPFTADLDFAVDPSAERPGAINVYATSPRHGGVTHLASVQVTLAGSGDEILREGESPEERIAVSAPASGATLSGGSAHVEGFGWASFEQTLLVEIVDVNGVVIGSAPVIVQGPDVGQPGPFAVDVPYSLSAAGPGRVIVRDISPAFGQTLHEATVDVVLS
jgi:hypothetical protein